MDGFYGFLLGSDDDAMLLYLGYMNAQMSRDRTITIVFELSIVNRTKEKICE